MVAFSFKAQFKAPILARTKRQTIRGLRKHVPRPGAPLSFYTGPRFSPKLLGRATVVRAGLIRLVLKGAGVEGVDLIEYGTVVELRGALALDAFAVEDGFADWAALKLFWAETHDNPETFSGMVTLWGDTFQEAAS